MRAQKKIKNNQGLHMHKNNSNSELGQRLGRNVSKMRKEAGLTQEELASRIEVEPETVSRMERGATVPSLSTLEMISVALGIRLSDLLEEPAPSLHHETRLIQAWITPLSELDKVFVLNIMKKLCRHCHKQK
jgi:transcriptional regulator with XRE-family HTH domain